MDDSTVRDQAMQPMVRVFHLCIEDSAQLRSPVRQAWQSRPRKVLAVVPGPIDYAQCSFLHGLQVFGELHCECGVLDLTCIFQNGADNGFVDSHQFCHTHTTLLQLTHHEYPLVSLANNVCYVDVPLQVDTEGDPEQFARGHLGDVLSIDDYRVYYLSGFLCRGEHKFQRFLSTRLACAERCFSVSAPTLWNALPPHLQHCSTLRTFKTNLKTHLFRQHFG